jgi:predicted ester cyclase
MTQIATSLHFEGLLNQGEMSVADEIISPGVRFHYPLGDLDGVDAVKQYIEAVRSAFPDIYFTIAETISDADRVATRWMLIGTQTGPFRGQPPSGAKVDVPGITIFHLKESRIYEMWISFDPAKFIGS